MSLNPVKKIFLIWQWKKMLQIKLLCVVSIFYSGKWKTYCRSSHRRCSVKKLLLEILENSQKITCDRVWGLRSPTILKKRLWHRCFPLIFPKLCNISYLCTYLKSMKYDINCKKIHDTYWILLENKKRCQASTP